MNPAAAALPVDLATPVPPLPPARRYRFRFDNRFLAPILITLILIAAQLNYGIGEVHYSQVLSDLTGGLVVSYFPTVVAIVVAILMELVLGRLFIGKWPHLASAYISGISVGILIRGPDLWPYVMCSLLAIASKYAIRVRGRHLWNPSNLGVSVVFFLAPDSAVSLGLQWGAEMWPMIVIWCLGSLILYRIGRLHICVTYAAAFILLSLVRSAITEDPWLAEVAPITGPMYQLFIFFMITDPKTTTRRKWSQCAVAVLVAVVEAIFRLNEVVHAPYFALFIVGPAANLVEIAWDAYRARGAAAKAL